MDETYLKARGQRVYLYSAVEIARVARWIFCLSKRRDIAAAKRFFVRATRKPSAPRVITLDGYAASHQAVAKLEGSRHAVAARVRPVQQVFE